MSAKVTGWLSLFVVLVLAALVSLQVLEYKCYDGSMPQSESLWPPK